MHLQKILASIFYFTYFLGCTLQPSALISTVGLASNLISPNLIYHSNNNLKLNISENESHGLFSNYYGALGSDSWIIN